tara:strand:- start:11436 stop:12530 length:1095 start_codon:yes stop_codon:yes gene_type:complete
MAELKSLQLSIINNWKVILNEDFISQWAVLHGSISNSNVFFSPVLFIAWYETYSSVLKLEAQFIVIKSNNKIVALMPLVIEKSTLTNAYLHKLVPIGKFEFDYHDPLILSAFEKDASQLIWQAITAIPNIDLIDIPRLRAVSPLKHISNAQKVAIAPSINLQTTKSFDEVIAALPKQLRQDVRRQERRLKEQGELQLLTCTTSEQAMQYFNDFETALIARWPDSYRAAGFLKALLKQIEKDKTVNFTILLLNEIPVSWHLGFKNNDSTFYYKPAFNFDYNKFSPGRVHLALLIKSSFDNNENLFDLCLGAEQYKTHWCNEEHSIYAYSHKSPIFLSKVKLLLSEVINSLRKSSLLHWIYNKVKK